MAESSPTIGARPVSAPAYEPLVRLDSPIAAGMTTPARANHPVLFPQPDFDDELPRPTAPRHWYKAFAKPATYVAAALAGAVLVTTLAAVMGARLGSPRANRLGVDSVAAPQPQTISAATLDQRADSLALALAAFSLRTNMYDTRQMGCTSLARGLQQVEAGWLEYNLARKATLAVTDPAREARDQSLYAGVRAVESRFERSHCPRP